MCEDGIRGVMIVNYVKRDNINSNEAIAQVEKIT